MGQCPGMSLEANRLLPQSILALQAYLRVKYSDSLGPLALRRRALVIEHVERETGAVFAYVHAPPPAFDQLAVRLLLPAERATVAPPLLEHGLNVVGDSGTCLGQCSGMSPEARPPRYLASRRLRAETNGQYATAVVSRNGDDHQLIPPEDLTVGPDTGRYDETSILAVWEWAS